MKKIILFLLVSTSTFSQSSDFEKKLRTKMEELIAMPTTSEEAREIKLNAIDVLMKITKDTVLQKDASALRFRLASQKLDVIQKFNIEKIPAEMLKNFEVSDDKFNSMVFLKHKKRHGNLYSYIGMNGNEPFLRLVCKYTGTEWVFINKIIFLIDAQTYEFFPQNIKREAYAGGLYERSDDLVTARDLGLIEALTTATNKIEIRFKGDRIRDKKITGKVAYTFKETLDLYNWLLKQK